MVTAAALIAVPSAIECNRRIIAKGITKIGNFLLQLLLLGKGNMLFFNCSSDSLSRITFAFNLSCLPDTFCDFMSF